MSDEIQHIQFSFLADTEEILAYMENLADICEAIWYDDDGTIYGIIDEEEKGSLTSRLEYFPMQPLSPLEFSPLSSQNEYLEEDFRSLPPVRCGSFFLYASHHEEQEPPQGMIPLCLEASTAFGSGHHETTQSCLQALEALTTTTTPSKALDIGCGSGVLSLAISSLWPSCAVIACDNDPESVETTKSNISSHKNTSIEVYLSEGFSDKALTEEAPYDLIVANIHSGPLCNMAVEVAAAMAEGGHLILSGFLSEDVALLIREYERHHFSTIEHITKAIWNTLVLRKKG
jgi:ribosomal protein L11 methyltransferase